MIRELKSASNTCIITLVLLLLSIPAFAQTIQLNDAEKEYLKKSYRYEKDGWIFLHIEGAPYERGFQRGYLTANEIDEAKATIAHTEWYEYGKDMSFWVKAADRLFENKVSEEYVQEMKGMADGATRAGKTISYSEILLLNGFMDVFWYWWPTQKDQFEEQAKPAGGCSAFIANGKMTTDGSIVMAHNTWFGYCLSRSFNIVLELIPEHGHRILMQSWGPSIYSMSDFFITDAGLVGTETTISDFEGFDSTGTPVFERARRAMQYADNIDEWSKIMTIAIMAVTPTHG